mmetsp:Transcript_17233/g.23952  ORF Transcript_17233/g.23952 Transcript_17233/m.23952 type:complete len:119 (-) Transcript_17233:324-680(-)
MVRPNPKAHVAPRQHPPNATPNPSQIPNRNPHAKLNGVPGQNSTSAKLYIPIMAKLLSQVGIVESDSNTFTIFFCPESVPRKKMKMHTKPATKEIKRIILSAETIISRVVFMSSSSII